MHTFLVISFIFIYYYYSAPPAQDAPTQEAVGLISYNFPGFSVDPNEAGEVAIRNGRIQEYYMVQGLNGKPGSVSFESISDPCKYLRHRNFLVHLDKNDDSQLFKDDATFFVRKNKFYPNYAALESSNYPGYFLRHQNYTIKLHREASFINSFLPTLYRMDASFLLASVSRKAMFESKNFPSYYWGTIIPFWFSLGIQARITNKKHHQFSVTLVTPGITGQEGTVSFYLNNERYLRHRDGLIRDEKPVSRQPDLFRKDATFYHHSDKWFPDFVSFEAVNYPGNFIRHCNYLLYIHKSDGSELYKNDASFKMLED